MRINIVQITNSTHVMFSLLYYLCHDLVRLLIYSMEDLGHDVIFNKDKFVPDRLNIIVTGYLMNIKEVEHLKKSGIKYIVYQAEILTPLGLNNDNLEKSHLSLIVQNNYLNLLQGAITVWDCFDFNRQYLLEKGIQSSLIRHGYHPEMEGRAKKEEQDIDVVFFGSVTNYRNVILKKLHKEGLQIKVLNFEPPAMRDDALRRAKVNLSIKANPTNMAHLPHSRVMTGLYLNTMTVSDPVYGQDWLHPMIDIVETENITTHINQIIQDGTYRTKSVEYKKMYMQYKMVDIMRPIMQQVEEIMRG